jgi:hypothetical protein
MTGRLPAEESGDGQALRAMMLLLRLHFAHVTEHVQEMAKTHLTVQTPQEIVHRTVLPALSEQERTLQTTVAKLVRLAPERLGCVTIKCHAHVKHLTSFFDWFCIALPSHLRWVSTGACTVLYKLSYSRCGCRK